MAEKSYILNLREDNIPHYLGHAQMRSKNVYQLAVDRKCRYLTGVEILRQLLINGKAVNSSDADYLQTIYKYKSNMSVDELSKVDACKLTAECIDLLDMSRIDNNLLKLINVTASTTGNLDLVKFIHSKNLDIMYPDEMPLQLAIRDYNPEVLKFYVSNYEYMFPNHSTNMNLCIEIALMQGQRVNYKILRESGIMERFDPTFKKHICLPSNVYIYDSEGTEFIIEMLENGYCSGHELTESKISTYASIANVKLIYAFHQNGLKVTDEDKADVIFYYQQSKNELPEEERRYDIATNGFEDFLWGAEYKKPSQIIEETEALLEEHKDFFNL